MAMATREKKRGAEEGKSSIFAGLNFPEVPTTLLSPPTSYAKLQTLEEDVEENTMITKEETETSVATTTPSAPSAKSLASLYSTGSEVQIAAGEYCYPDLPISIVSMNLPAMNNMTPLRGGEEDTNDNEKTSLLPSTVDSSVTPYAQTSINNTSSSQILDEDASLVSDLIAENARLAQEVMLLRQSMNAAGTGAGLTGATATSSGATQHASMHMHQGSASLVPNQGSSHAAAISMSPMHEEVIARQREALQIANNTNTSSSGTTTHANQQHLQGLNMPMIEPRPGMKHICCGKCRTWCTAPIAAPFVRCPQCQVVNRSPPPTQASTNGMNRDTVDNPNQEGDTITIPIFPWLKSCFASMGFR